MIAADERLLAIGHEERAGVIRIAAIFHNTIARFAGPLGIRRRHSRGKLIHELPILDGHIVLLDQTRTIVQGHVGPRGSERPGIIQKRFLTILVNTRTCRLEDLTTLIVGNRELADLIKHVIGSVDLPLFAFNINNDRSFRVVQKVLGIGRGCQTIVSILDLADSATIKDLGRNRRIDITDACELITLKAIRLGVRRRFDLLRIIINVRDQNLVLEHIVPTGIITADSRIRADLVEQARVQVADIRLIRRHARININVGFVGIDHPFLERTLDDFACGLIINRQQGVIRSERGLGLFKVAERIVLNAAILGAGSRIRDIRGDILGRQRHARHVTIINIHEHMRHEERLLRIAILDLGLNELDRLDIAATQLMILQDNSGLRIHPADQTIQAIVTGIFIGLAGRIIRNKDTGIERVMVIHIFENSGRILDRTIVINRIITLIDHHRAAVMNRIGQHERLNTGPHRGLFNHRRITLGRIQAEDLGDLGR